MTSQILIYSTRSLTVGAGKYIFLTHFEASELDDNGDRLPWRLPDFRPASDTSRASVMRLCVVKVAGLGVASVS